ncbi:Mitochondrial FAD carrier protein FLX1 [Wickerhamiella sorbophila]|uniref:Mitochondrial FAD carrier protein FLX1 n=1 Tax=Wickerhamiella sorbophila TaxID=45607 RepID=A0A2T0FHM4_9ASCO|nr:Mitochondrial FAD carrier protein FLX1 [Wickerhamiella sorbophila]PRT54502.1 Mitochondrial FAD carrier protein FLX1 [Wickerhamiella sorbophila]
MDLLAGISAGTVTTLVMHPLDLAKVRMQVGRSRTLGQAVGELLGHPRDAYRGIAPNLIGNAAGWGVYFYLYRQAKNALDAYGIQKTPLTLLSASFSTGVLTQTLTNPIWVVKTVMLASKRSDANAAQTSWSAARQIYKCDGPRGFFRGLIPGFGGTAQSAIHFVLYDLIKPHISTDLPDPVRYITSSFFSKSIAAVLMYPHQVLRAEMQFKRIGLVEAFRLVYQENGFKAFYRGLSANLLRVVPAVCLTMATYETTLDLLGGNK